MLLTEKQKQNLCKQIEGLYERIGKLEAERDALRACLAEVEAEAARLRKALTPFADAGTIAAAIGLGDGVLIGTIGNDAYELYVYHLYWARDALVSCSTGRETAERLRLLEAVAEAAKAFIEQCSIVECVSENSDSTCYAPCLRVRLKAALEALKGGDDDAGTGT